MLLHQLFSANCILNEIRYKIVLDTDAEQYGGHKRLDHSVDFFTANDPWDNRRCSLMVGHSIRSDITPSI